MTCLDRIKAALLTVSQNVSHYSAAKKDAPYIVWAEDGQTDTLYGDDGMEERCITGTVDLYSENENEPLAAAIEAALGGVCGFELTSVQFEDGTGLIHREWSFEIEDT